MNHNDLIQHFLEGSATAEDSATLSQLIETDAMARARYLDLAEVHAALLADETLHAPMPARSDVSSKAHQWISWRPLAAAAAGLVMGLFSATAVWAFASGKMPRIVKVPLANGDFEAGAAIPRGSVPQHLGQWSGDPCAIVEEQGRVRPRGGRHMLKFLAASNTGDFVGSKNMAADLWQVIVLPGNGARTVRIRAWFNADTEKQARFHIAAVAGNDANVNAKELWEQRYNESAPLPFARTMIVADREPATWEAGELTLQVPPQARVLVIGIAAYRLADAPADQWFPAQFVDDVSVTISEEMSP
ncbi:MAG: hypothetical protein WCF18_21700 [Chthoniobacteraceae bacterium]